MDGVTYPIRDQVSGMRVASEGSTVLLTYPYDAATQVCLDGGADLASRFLTTISADYCSGDESMCRDIEEMFRHPANYEMFCTFAGLDPDEVKRRLFAIPANSLSRGQSGNCDTVRREH